MKRIGISCNGPREMRPYGGRIELFKTETNVKYLTQLFTDGSKRFWSLCESWANGKEFKNSGVRDSSKTTKSLETQDSD